MLPAGLTITFGVVRSLLGRASICSVTSSSCCECLEYSKTQNHRTQFKRDREKEKKWGYWDFYSYLLVPRLQGTVQDAPFGLKWSGNVARKVGCVCVSWKEGESIY